MVDQGISATSLSYSSGLHWCRSILTLSFHTSFPDSAVEVDNNVSSTIYYADVPTTFSNIMNLNYTSINLTDNPDTFEMRADFVDFHPQSQQIYFMGRSGSGAIIDLNGTLVRIFAEEQSKAFFFCIFCNSIIYRFYL